MLAAALRPSICKCPATPVPVKALYRHLVWSPRKCDWCETLQNLFVLGLSILVLALLYKQGGPMRAVQQRGIFSLLVLVLGQAPCASLLAISPIPQPPSVFCLIEREGSPSPVEVSVPLDT
jgi:hypothetical protein